MLKINYYIIFFIKYYPFACIDFIFKFFFNFFIIFQFFFTFFRTFFEKKWKKCKKLKTFFYCSFYIGLFFRYIILINILLIKNYAFACIDFSFYLIFPFFFTKKWKNYFFNHRSFLFVKKIKLLKNEEITLYKKTGLCVCRFGLKFFQEKLDKKGMVFIQFFILFSLVHFCLIVFSSFKKCTKRPLS